MTKYPCKFSRAYVRNLLYIYCNSVFLSPFKIRVIEIDRWVNTFATKTNDYGSTPSLT